MYFFAIIFRQQRGLWVAEVIQREGGQDNGTWRVIVHRVFTNARNATEWVRVNHPSAPIHRITPEVSALA